MGDFPKLRSGAGAQYPLRYQRRYETYVTKFLDGTEQRFRQHKSAIKTWDIPLTALTDDEARKFELYFEQKAGRSGEFSFEDPATGQLETTCHFESDRCDVTQSDHEKNELRLKVKSGV